MASEMARAMAIASERERAGEKARLPHPGPETGPPTQSAASPRPRRLTRPAAAGSDAAGSAAAIAAAAGGGGGGPEGLEGDVYDGRAAGGGRAGRGPRS